MVPAHKAFAVTLFGQDQRNRSRTAEHQPFAGDTEKGLDAATIISDLKISVQPNSLYYIEGFGEKLPPFF